MKLLRRFLLWIGWWSPPLIFTPDNLEKVVLDPKRQRPQKPLKPATIKKCLVADKFMFTREQAEENRKKQAVNSLNGIMRIYCCEYCSNWHLTHQKRKKW